jgi:hypothetical protein
VSKGYKRRNVYYETVGRDGIEFSTEEQTLHTDFEQGRKDLPSPQNTLRTVLVAPKGYGKTLLLKEAAVCVLTTGLSSHSGRYPFTI